MSSFISGKQYKESLRERLAEDAGILKDVGNLASFGMCVLSGGPMSLETLIPVILKAAGSAISSSIAIIKAFTNPNSCPTKLLSDPREKFRIVFYTYLQQAYLEAISSALGSIHINSLVDEKHKTRILSEDEVKQSLENCVDDIQQSEVYYNFCIDPSEKEIPLYDSFGKWLALSLEASGASPFKAREFSSAISLDAKKRLHLKLSLQEQEASWIRSYLVLERLEGISSITSDLKDIKQSLEHWTDSTVHLKEKQKNAWKRYRSVLQSLPDDKDSMYNEDFGVREVFVAPQARYYVAGARASAGSPQEIPSISKLFGALISNRIPGDDLVILCGGPGSGKSSLCRMLASELASNPRIHPVFLKLKRCNEGLDICGFVADNLRNAGIIQDISDLHQVPNLILILDGFDELVMASRQRLRLFFNHLQDDLRTGPFRNAKAIISGRDTLFPNGQGLPRSAHVITLVPFDRERVTIWGAKWRGRSKERMADEFRPEVFYEEDEPSARKSALHHLVTWPMTLHLVAQVHSSGYLDTTEKSKQNIEKAYLYRSILAETARRQEEKRPGGGRLDREGIREFLMSLAWEMYIRSVDCLDINDAISIIETFFPRASQEELQDLSDTNVLNAPEIQKKEETGFEFVHKSFAEYLVAEKLAGIFEDVCYKVPDRTTKRMVWHMSSEDVTQRLTSILGLRLFPAEVQEMLEPMLGCFDHFSKKTNVKDTVPSAKRSDGLLRIIERFSEVYTDMLKGTALRRTQDATEGKLLIESPLEAYANYAAGVAIIGSSAASQLNKIVAHEQKVFFQGNPFEGAFWRFVWILQSGGIRLDAGVSARVFSGMTVDNEQVKERIGDWSIPFHLAALTNVHGYQSDLLKSVSTLSNRIHMDYLVKFLEQGLLGYTERDIHIRDERIFFEHNYTDHQYRHYTSRDHFGISDFTKLLIEANLIPPQRLRTMESSEWNDDLRYFLEKIAHSKYSSNVKGHQERMREIYSFLRYQLNKLSEQGLMDDEYFYQFRKRIEYLLEKRRRDSRQS